MPSVTGQSAPGPGGPVPKASDRWWCQDGEGEKLIQPRLLVFTDLCPQAWPGLGKAAHSRPAPGLLSWNPHIKDLFKARGAVFF